MRHNVGFRKLQRNTSHRLAMLRNMVTSLLEHEQIKTTVPKAKECRRMAEKVITLGKHGGLHNVRSAQKIVRNRVILAKVFGELKDRYATRPGGYTRIMRAGFRRGDAAEVAILELVDRPAGGEPVEVKDEDAAKTDKKVEAKTEKPKKEKVEAKDDKPKAEKSEKAPKTEKKPKAEKK